MVKLVILILFVAVVSPSSQASILQNLNGSGIFAVLIDNNDMVVEHTCTALTSSSSEAASCPVRGFPIPLADFKAQLDQSLSPEIQQLQSEKDSLAAESLQEQQELDAINKRLGKETDADIKSGLLAEMNRIGQSLQQSKARVKEIETVTDSKNFDRLFGANGLVRDQTLYQVFGDTQVFSNLRLMIKHIDPVFLKVAGKRFGTNSWFDVETRRIFWAPGKYDFSWSEASADTPQGYQFLPTQQGFMTDNGYVGYADSEIYDSLQRLSEAMSRGETGFVCANQVDPPANCWFWSSGFDPYPSPDGKGILLRFDRPIDKPSYTLTVEPYPAYMPLQGLYISQNPVSRIQ